MHSGPGDPATDGDLLPATAATPADTEHLGRRLARILAPGDVVALYGDLGAGKTVLVRGICEGLGLDPDEVTSPTFTILHEYCDARAPIYHFDAYRVERLDEFYGLGYEEYFFGDGISIVEWADRVEPLIPDHAIRIRIDHEGGDCRRIALVRSDVQSAGR